MTLREKQYVAALEKSHEDWKARAVAAVDLLEQTLCGQALALGQTVQGLRAQAAQEKDQLMQDVYLSMAEGFAIYAEGLGFGN